MRHTTYMLFFIAALIGGCSGKTVSLACTGTSQRPNKPDTSGPSGVVALSITKYPAYVKLWNKSYGMAMLSEPYMQNYNELSDGGDNVFLANDSDPNLIGVFNRISGRLQLATRQDIFDVRCAEKKPLI